MGSITYLKCFNGPIMGGFTSSQASFKKHKQEGKSDWLVPGWELQANVCPSLNSPKLSQPEIHNN